MLNTEDFLKRLDQMLSHYGLSAAAFADKIGIQRSGISHLLSGRNKPSLDFILKIVSVFPEIDLYWLLAGTGSMLRSENQTSAKTIETASDKIIIFHPDGTFSEYKLRK